MKIFGIVVGVAGIVLLALSYSIKNQVSEGREKIARGQRDVDTVNTLFSVNSNTKPVGRAITSSPQAKIRAGTKKADEYQRLAEQLQVGGIILLIVGAGMTIFSRRKSRHH